MRCDAAFCQNSFDDLVIVVLYFSRNERLQTGTRLQIREARCLFCVLTIRDEEPTSLPTRPSTPASLDSIISCTSSLPTVRSTSRRYAVDLFILSESSSSSSSSSSSFNFKNDTDKDNFKMCSEDRILSCISKIRDTILETVFAEHW